MDPLVNENKLRKVPLHHRAGVRITSAAKGLRKKENAVWRVSRKCPMFLKASHEMTTQTGRDGVVKKVPTGKILFRRSQRLIGSNAYNAMAAGAGAYCAETIKARAKIFRAELADEGRVPFVPTISPGAAAALEQMLCAYVQEAMYYAAQIRKGLRDKPAKRLNAKMAMMGFKQANEAIFGGASSAPRSVAIIDAPKKQKPAKKDKKGKNNENEAQAADEE